jgi:hypothetical protein
MSDKKTQDVTENEEATAAADESATDAAPEGVTVYKIEKGVKFGGAIPSGRKKFFYPWAEMEKGDSFFMPNRTIRQVSSEKSKAAKTHGMKLVARTLTEDGVKGVRVWRVE